MLSMSKGSSKKKKEHVQSPMWGLLVVIAFLCTMGFIFSRMYVWDEFTGNSAEDMNVKEYEALLARAKELTNRYKELHNLAEPVTQPDLVLGMAPTGGGRTKAVNLRSLPPILPNKPKLDLVLGMAQDTDPKNLAVFCKSLRSVSKADVIIFTNEPIPPKHLEIAEENRVTLIGFDLSKVQPAYLQRYHPSTLRWPLFYNHFKENPSLSERYQRVWMIDVRDSYFQSDPFSFVSSSSGSGSGSGDTGSNGGGAVQKEGFHVFSGVETFPIRECGWNSGWVKDCFGPATLDAIGDKGIICSGVSAGTMPATLTYLRTMNDIVTGTGDKQGQGQGGKFPQCERNGVDQGVHNVLVHTGALAGLGLKQWGQADGPVANMQSRMSKIDCIMVGAAEERCTVRNKAGVAVSVVHQYDRYPDLQAHLFQKYVAWVKTGDLSAEWAYEPACANYNYKADSDLFKAVCDVSKKGGVTSAASCCAECDRAKGQGCQAFTFYAGACFFKDCGAGGDLSSRSRGPTAIKGAVSGFLKRP